MTGMTVAVYGICYDAQLKVDTLKGALRRT